MITIFGMISTLQIETNRLKEHPLCINVILRSILVIQRQISSRKKGLHGSVCTLRGEPVLKGLTVNFIIEFPKMRT